MSQYSKVFILLVLGTIFTRSIVSASMVQHYITPLPVFSCPTGESCLTLSALAANTSEYLKLNATLIFLAGHHTLDMDFTVTDMDEFLMLSNSDSESVIVNITCNRGTLLTFTRITRMQIKGLRLIRCPSRIESLDHFTLKDSSIHGGNNDDSALYITQTSANIIRSNFNSNRGGHYHDIPFFTFYIQELKARNVRRSSARLGGAIFINNSNIDISYTHFDHNAAHVGGAIFSQMGTNITVTNCTFINNGATGCRRSNRCLGIVSCIDGHCHGGALFLESGCTLTATNSTFVNNTAESSGGAIALFRGTIFDTNNVYSGNNVIRILKMGGAIAAYDGSKLIVHNSCYKRNEAGSGAVFLFHLHCSVTVDNGSFESNEANRRGGVMRAYESSITVDNSFFDKNNVDSADGGVVYAEFNTRISINNSFFGNSQARSGGVMYARFSSITIDNCCFGKNSGIEGGVVFTYSSDITVKDSSFNDSKASYGGVFYSTSRSNIVMENISFNDNTVDIDGGVIYARSSSGTTIRNSSFGNSKAIRNGGVIFVGGGSSIIANYISFDKNMAVIHGGVIYATFTSSIHVHNCSFGNNYAGLTAGVVYAGLGCNIILDNGRFDDNRAGSNGGVVHAEHQSIIVVESSFFDSNIADNDGGVVYAYFSASINVHNSSFDRNVASNRGGVMYSYSINNIIFSNQCIFFNNSASEGGVVYLHQASLTDLGSMYYDNMAYTNGGVMALNRGLLKVTASSFINNSAEINGGVVCATNDSYEDHVTLKESTLHNNKALSGGVIAMFSNASFQTVIECTFTSNEAFRGGVIYLFIKNNLTVKYSNFTHNSANKDGGVIYSHAQNQVIINNSKVILNVAEENGGVFCSLSQSELIITGITCTFIGNQAARGGVLYANENKVAVYSENLLISNNTVIETGGAMHLIASNLCFLGERSKLVGNQARSGGVLYTSQSRVDVYSQIQLVANNSAIETGGAICLCDDSNINYFNGNNILIGNRARSGGLFYASESKLNIYSQNLLMAKNTAQDTGGAVHLSKTDLTFFNGNNTITGNVARTSGGGIYLTEGQLVFSDGNNTLVGNQAGDGGAIYASESRLLLKKYSQINVTANLAIDNGGGLYLIGCEIKIKEQTSYITRNRANSNGGGIHAAKSSIISEGVVHFISNEAENGGGVSLERSAKLDGISPENGSINFISNRASRYGGALYVNDKTNPDVCDALTILQATSLTECFSVSLSMMFLDNFAHVSGFNLFGGLLDRCSVHGIFFQGTDSETNKIGVTSFLDSSNITESELDTISSEPVRLCFCKDGQPDCNYHPELIQVNRGNKFSTALIAYDHISNAVSAIVESSIDNSNSSTGYLGEAHIINEGCTELQFNLFTSESVDSANLMLSMTGPCSIVGVTEKSIMIEITCTCPIGFQVYIDDQKLCDCVCHALLQPYDKTSCNASTESIIRRENFWVTYINHTNSSGYIVYPNCPYDYCYPSENEISVNLNLHNGSDAQCVSNREGILCGTCKPGYSVSLGSSQCLQCPTNWPALLVMIIIVFILSGIGLVALLLVLNLTVAIGSLNAIIFFANTLAANKSALFPSDRISFASVFISSLNFDIGVNTCFYDGMDTYTKTWLQLAFPVYIIILVVIIIKLSNHFTTFGRLIGRKDPVATLATLVLLSYTKLLQIIIIVFSSATLNYPDGPKAVWLPDATVEYFTGKHIALFFAAVLILLFGFVYTSLLFSWQWFLLCPKKKTKWIINQKTSLFLETYHAPYTPRHRYWTGLLLLIRVSIYLISAFDPSSGDPRISLLATVVIVSLLFLYISVFGVKMYKRWSMNAMESLTYFNIIATSVFTWYTFDINGNQKLVTNISVGITFAQLVMVVSYHTCKYTCSNQKLVQKFQSVIYKQVNEKLGLRKRKIDQLTEPGTGMPEVQSKPTYSVVELPIHSNSESATSQNQESNNIAEESKHSAMTESSQRSSCSSGIQAAAHDHIMWPTNPAVSCEHTSLDVKSNSRANSQIDNSVNVQLVEEQTFEMSQFNGTDLSSTQN